MPVLQEAPFVCRTCLAAHQEEGIDWETTFEIAEFICFPCADHFWLEYMNAVRKGNGWEPMENKQVFEVGQEVTGSDLGGKRMVVDEVGVIYTYKLRFKDGRKDTSGRQYYTYQLESVPMLTEEEAWMDVGILIGKRSKSPLTWASESWKTQTRHQCYVILGSAKIQVTEEVKNRVRKLIERADSEDFDG